MGTMHDLMLDDIHASEDGWALITDTSPVWATESNTEEGQVYLLINVQDGANLICTCRGWRMSKIGEPNDNECTHVKDWREKQSAPED
jgi:hypothetical protein